MDKWWIEVCEQAIKFSNFVLLQKTVFGNLYLVLVFKCRLRVCAHRKKRLYALCLACEITENGPKRILKPFVGRNSRCEIHSQPYINCHPNGYCLLLPVLMFNCYATLNILIITTLTLESVNTMSRFFFTVTVWILSNKAFDRCNGICFLI